MSKWTKWIPHTGDECPVDGERVKMKAAPGVWIETETPQLMAWSRITHYKRLKKNVEAENKPSDPEHPETIITGPGEYVTEAGEKATITEFTNHRHSAKGVIEGKAHSWRLNGVSSSQHYPCDITGPWVEDEPEPKPEEPEMWVGVVRPYDGADFCICSNPYATKSEADKSTEKNPLAATVVGTFKLVKVDDSTLSHTVEEGE